MNPTTSRVWSYLDHWHRGRNMAVTGEALASALGLQQRDLRRHIEYLREHEHRPIGSTSCEKAPGYFVMQDIEDVRVGMRSRWKAATKAIATMRKQAVGIAGIVNLEMEFGDKEAA